MPNEGLIDRSPMKAIIPLAAITAVVAFVLLTSCKSETPEETSTQEEVGTAEAAPEETLVAEAAPLVGREWKLVDLCGVGIPEDSKASLMFLPDDRVTGSGSVNRFNGPLRIVDGAIEAGPIASTRMAGSPEEMEREQLYLNALGAAKSVRTLGDDQLIIHVDGKDLPLRFRSVTSP